MSEDKPFEFRPNKKQAEFLSTNADVCLMGGGLGSGKTLAAVILLLRLNDPDGPGYKNPRYNALICRKHYKDLRDIIAKTKLIYPKVDPGAKFHSGDLVWKFSSGAMIQIAYFDNVDACTTMVQGAEYCTIVMDEAMHWETDEVFLYLMSRLRNPFGMKGLMRLTSNPGKYPWLRDYFKIDNEGTSTDFIREYELDDGTIIKKRIKYIQAKLQDNPHLPKDYQATIMMMSMEDKLALLDGRWDAYSSVKGMVYEHEIALVDKEHRCCSVPYDPAVDVYTFFDIGISDMCVILFVQYVGKEIHIIDKIEQNNRSIKDYIAELKKLESEKGYRYAKHLLPHDSQAREKFSGSTILEQFEQYYKNVEALPRLPIADGILKTKSIFSNLWFDNKTDTLEQLRNYKRAWNEKLQVWGDPVHDRYSHCADAVRYVSYYTPTQSTPHRIVPKRPFRGSF
jgi:hypothetical protein